MSAILSRLVLDAMLLFVILVVAIRGQAPPWRRLGIVCLAVAASNAFWVWCVFPWIWIFAIIPLVISAGLILRLTLPITTRKIAVVLAVFVAVHVVIKALEAFFA